MANLMSEELKIDMAFIPTAALNGDNVGQYFPVTNWRKYLFVVQLGAMAAAATSQIRVMQATSQAGAGAAVIANLTDTITANVGAEVVTLTLNAVQVADAVVINGLTYTAAAAADLPNRVFDQSGNDAADAASLVLAINHATAGVPGITAQDLGGGVVSLAPTIHGEATVTIGAISATITPATVQATGYVEADAGMLDTANGFDHIAVRITNSAGMPTAAVLIRGNGRYSAVQHVAAEDVAV